VQVKSASIAPGGGASNTIVLAAAAWKWLHAAKGWICTYLLVLDVFELCCCCFSVLACWHPCRCCWVTLLPGTAAHCCCHSSAACGALGWPSDEQSVQTHCTVSSFALSRHRLSRPSHSAAQQWSKKALEPQLQGHNAYFHQLSGCAKDS